MSHKIAKRNIEYKHFAGDCSPYVKAQMSWHRKDKCLDPHNDIGSINVAHIGMHNVKT
jgi:hypothetical protein